MSSILPKELHDFRNFLYVTWEHLNLPEPTPVQYRIAEFLQNGPRRRVVQAFRGVGKSFVTSAYVVWRLAMNPQANILVVSASKSRADDFSTFTRMLIDLMPILEPLKPQEGQRDSRIAFDVGPAEPDHSPSVKSVGVSGQLTGSRADEIVADDIEVVNNSATQDMRDKLADLIKEFDAILKPGGQITYLGTPQCEDSVYSRLNDRGYTTRIWPARYPDKALVDIYGDKLCTEITTELSRNPKLVNKPVDPKRFSDKDLLERELSYGRSGFQLQFMLNTSLSDADRYPLKLNDLVVVSGCSTWAEAPISVTWASGPLQVDECKSLPHVGLRGDKFVAPMRVSSTFEPWMGAVMYIDPAGRGADETAYAVVKMHAGNLWLTASGGLRGGSTEENLTKLAQVAKSQKVNHVRVEANYGDGMFTQLFKPILNRIYPVSVEDTKVGQVQKEKRVIGSLEPVMNQHRLIVAAEVIKADFHETDLNNQLFYQISRLTNERGALRHDDRIDALAGAVSYWTERMSVDQHNAEENHRQELLQADLDAFMESIGKTRPTRGNIWARVNQHA